MSGSGRTLVVTNDFPPRAGGIQTFVYELAIRQPADSLVVYAPDWPGAAEFDAKQPFPVIRARSRALLPVPSVARQARNLAIDYDCDRVWFGSAAPLGILAPMLRRRTGIRRAVALTHGHEAAWATVPVGRQTLRRIAGAMDVVTYLGGYTRSRMAPALTTARQVVRLPPGVDTAVFHPGVDGSAVRARLGLADRPTIVCVSRLVVRKGQDMLIKSLPWIQEQVPRAALLIVGTGSDRPRLERLAAGTGVAADVVFTGAVPGDELPEHYAAGDVFAMPCRTRHGGMDVEGLGIVYLEASAIGLPVVAGSSGGAPDAVRDGETGYVVDGRSMEQVVSSVVRLLTDPELARTMGKYGREWVERQWQWDVLAARLAELLAG
ncbi:MAG TPA: glycosyltransferase family 4 protein [Mycobacteriales bacterium]|nr:glycosyltransferase family 4 protein [Mycobacteriales bacterium]